MPHSVRPETVCSDCRRKICNSEHTAKRNHHSITSTNFLSRNNVRILTSVQRETLL